MGKQKKIELTEADVAYQALRERKAPIHYKDLVVEIRQRLGYDEKNPGPNTAQIHTEINLDSRLNYLGKGMWGLIAWDPKSKMAAIEAEPSEHSYQPKQADYIWDEDEAEEEVEEDEDVEGAGFIPDGPDAEEDEELDEDADDEVPLDVDELLGGDEDAEEFPAEEEEDEEEPPTSFN